MIQFQNVWIILFLSVYTIDTLNGNYDIIKRETHTDTHQTHSQEIRQRRSSAVYRPQSNGREGERFMYVCNKKKNN